jgi:hypothetical protein
MDPTSSDDRDHGPIPPRRRWLRRLIVSLCVLGLVSMVVASAPFLWQWSCRREVERHLEELRVAGVPTTPEALEASYQLPSGADDCTQLWLDALEPLNGTEEEFDACGLPFVSHPLPAEPPLPGDGWAELSDVEALLARYRPSLDKMQEAAKCGGAARYPSDFADGILAPRLELDGLRVAVGLLRLQAEVHAHHDEMAVAIELLGTLRALAHSLDGRPDLISLLIRTSASIAANRALARYLPYAELSDGNLTELQTAVNNLEFRDEFVAAVRGERVTTLLAFPQVYEPADGQPMYPGFAKWSDQLLYLRLMQHAEQAAHLAPPNNIEACRIAENQANETFHSWRGYGCFVCAMMIPALTQVAVAVAQAEENRDATIFALAAERYRLRHGKWPDTLSDVPPDLLPLSWTDRIPVDPFNGQPLRYSIADEDLRVYSVGQNKTDDGGFDDPREGDMIIHVRRAANP